MNIDSLLLERMGHSPDTFKDRITVVTGGAQGIGKQIAKGLAALGARVIIIDRQKEKSEQTLTDIQCKHPGSFFLHADISQQDQLISALRTVNEKCGAIDVLVNNAMKSFIGSYSEETQETWDAVFDINLRYPVAAIRYLLPQMLERHSGIIANIISLEGLTCATAYSATKVGMRSVTLSIASEIGNDAGVSLFAFAPGIVETETVTDYFYPELAKRFGMTMQDIIDGIGGNPGYEGLMPAEHCAAGFIDCVVNAGQYHGQIVGPFLSLAKADIIDFNEGLQTSGASDSQKATEGLETVNQSLRDYLSSVTEINRNLEHRIDVRTKELEEALKEVQKKNEPIEETNIKLIDSIRYAERIQKAMLPEKNEVRKTLPESFVIWEPKDIVGGDFYQIYRLPDCLFLVVGDCTGHGVPGGFMTMMVLTMLNGIIYGSPTRNPASILTMLNGAVKSALKQDRDVSKLDDGLDIAICYIDPPKHHIDFAGARFPLIQSENGVVEVIKADRKSVGYKRTSLDSKFTTKKVAITSGKTFYLASDGLQDQLGGPNNQAFGRKAVLDMLTAVHDQPMENQKTLIQQAIKNHQGTQERQDDLTIIGFKAPVV